MMTSSRPHGEITGSFTSRRGQSSRLSISDPSHHVTEAIGTLYGEDDDSGIEGGRPLSFVPGLSYQEQIQQPQRLQHDQSQQSRKILARSTSDQPQHAPMTHGDNGGLRKVPALALLATSQRNNAHDHHPKSPSSPTLSLREVQADPSGQQFPLTNIDNPNDIAQELSNLQALRRISMDVGNSIDPDMPPMSLATMPSIAPRGDDDENDPSRLLWVPARVHPELAPTEFRSFLEKRLQSIRRRSGDSFLTVGDDTSRSESGSLNSSLRRKKSMLSRQIDNSGGRGAVDYVDGTERLERRQSPELSLDELVKDPTKAVQKLAQESHGYTGGPENSVDDMPILPMAPGGGLRRSTRTTYRKGGSLRSGDKASFSRRVAQRQQNNEPAETTIPSTVDSSHEHSLARVQSEPVTENYSRPTRSVRRQQKFSQESPAASVDSSTLGLAESHSMSTQAYQDQLPIQGSSTQHNTPILQVTGSDEAQAHQDNQYPQTFPQRSSSQAVAAQQNHHTEHVTKETPAQLSHHSAANNTAKQPPLQQQHAQRSSNSTQTLSSSPGSKSSPLPAGNACRTDTLTFIPTLTQDDKKVDKKTKKDRDDESSSSSIKSGSAWKWFKGVADDKEKRKDESKKSKSKGIAERVQDNVRLDVIQTSIDKTAVKGRESLVLDRDNIDSKLQDDRKKESNRKSDSKKEKDGSIFSSIFGGSKKKEEKEKSKKNQHFLQVPEDPPYKPLQPDVDYNWSRFPLLEERAIYRMAHIKLANPRRTLQSQVLLSNFMYSYLAIVQAMHPQMNVPISPQQKRLEEEARRKQQEQEYLAQREMQEEQDAQQSLDQYNFDYHRMAVQYADSGSDEQVDYVDDAQIYEDEHGNDHHHDYDDDNSEGYGQDVKEYFEYSDNVADHHDHGRDGLW